MFQFIVRRILWAIPVLFFVSLVTFFLMHQAPGGPFDKDNNRKQVDGSTLKALNSRFGLNKPQYVNPAAVGKFWDAGERNPFVLGRAYLDSQYFGYIGNAARGDLGPSYRQRGKSVQQILAEHWGYSLRLGVIALVFALVVGIPLGVLAALKQNTAFDYIGLLFATIGISVPTFVTGLLVIIVFGTKLGWISITSNDWNTWRPYLAPGLVLGLASMAGITRITRTAVLEVKRQDFVRTARAKGLAESPVILRHIMRNAMIPVVTTFGPILLGLVTGAVITESIFSIPGIGKYFVDSIFQRDYSMIMGTTLAYALLLVIVNLLVDLSYGFLDPRIRVH